MADVIAFPGWPQLPSLPFPERCAGALRTIVLLNPPHTAIGSRIPREHLPPLGLLSVGGPLIDAGFDVHLVDAEFGHRCRPTRSCARWRASSRTW